MSVDTAKLGKFVAEAMENIEEVFPDAKLGEIMLICEIQGEHDGGTVTTTRYICTAPQIHIHLGLLHAALLAAER